MKKQKYIIIAITAFACLSVYNIEMARKFKTEELARRCLQHLEEVEGEWYTFEIKMIEI